MSTRTSMTPSHRRKFGLRFVVSSVTQFFTHAGRREKDAAHDTGDSVGDLQDSRKASTKKRQGVVDLQRSFLGQVMPSCGYQKEVWISDIIKISRSPSCSHAKEPPNYKKCLSIYARSAFDRQRPC